MGIALKGGFADRKSSHPDFHIRAEPQPTANTYGGMAIIPSHRRPYEISAVISTVWKRLHTSDDFP